MEANAGSRRDRPAIIREARLLGWAEQFVAAVDFKEAVEHVTIDLSDGRGPVAEQK